MEYALHQDVSQDSVQLVDSPEEAAELPPLSDELLLEWKTEKPSYGRVHFMRYILSSTKLADVTFLVKREDEPERISRIMAHKSILKNKSEFFSALFSDRWFNEEVDLREADITDNEFRDFLMFVYTNKVAITKDNVTALHHLASIYQIKSLGPQCEQFLINHIDDDNALSLFATMYLHDLKKTSDLLKDLVHFICRNGAKMLEKEEMLKMDANQLLYIFKSGRCTFQSTGWRLMGFCFRWASRKFGRISPNDFCKFDEIFRFDLGLESYFENENIPKLRSLLHPFERLPPVEKTDEIYEVLRFNTNSQDRKPWKYRRSRADRVSFRCSETITLTGVALYGPYCRAEGVRCDYNIDINVYHHGESHKNLLSVFRRVTAAGIVMDEVSKMLRVDLPPVYLQAKEWYTISAKITGPDSYFGRMGCEGKLLRAKSSPVLFEFQDASAKDPEAKLANPTGLTIGQIPKLYFKLVDTDEQDDVQVLESE